MNIKKKVFISSLIAVVLLLIALLIWTVWANRALTVSEIIIESSDIPESFSGFRIAQISDLHNAEFGKDNEKLVEMLKDTEPDIIVITGDMVDADRTDMQIAFDFAEKAVSIAPTYYVTGNHEGALDDYSELKEGLTDVGVTVMTNEKVEITQNGETLTLAGIDDPAFDLDFEDTLSELLSENKGYTVLLSHRPEFFDAYVENGAQLVFSGHAHGGQFRLPIIGGLYAPGQGMFPEYCEGVYKEGKTQMIVSRGLGNSIIPLRFNNRPEIVVAELVSK